MDQVTEIDAAAGTIVERPLTPDEVAEQAQREQDWLAEQQAQADAAAAQAAATQAAIAHAKSLGFTDEMIAVMYPNLQPTSPASPEVQS